MSSRLDALPDELLLDNILPLLDISDLLSVSQTNHHIRNVSSDSTFWKRKIRADFNLPPSVTARQSGWKKIYAGLRRPSLHVWGATSNSRLGLLRSHPALSRSADVNRPAHLALDSSVGLVDLQASGFGFVGLDSKGNVWVWGALDGTQYVSRSNPNWMHPGSIAPEPRKLALTGIASIACGRKHVACLAKDGTVWELTAWGKARKLDTEHDVPSSHVSQISTGWSHTAALSQSGRSVTIWHPSFANRHDGEPPAVGRTIYPDKGEEITVAILRDSPAPFVLPPLPASADEGSDDNSERIVTIASGEHAVLALTESGRIWSCWVGTDLSEIGSVETGEAKAFWEEHPQFRHPHSEEREKITHISAQFNNFFAYSPGSPESEPPYSDSLVLKGSVNQLRFTKEAGAEPEIIPELQGRGVTKVALGDWHFAALTVRGEVLTWGQYCDGSLGLGQLGKGGGVEKPTLVQFGSEEGQEEGEKPFAFALTASGWHTGALTVDLSRPSASEPTSTSSSSSFYNPTSARMAQLDPQPSGRPIPGLGFAGIRIGFAGRGGQVFPHQARGGVGRGGGSEPI